MSLPRDSTTHSFNGEKDNVFLGKTCADDTELSIWFHIDNEIEATEEIVGLGEYGKTLTVIATPILDGEDEQDEVERY